MNSDIISSRQAISILSVLLISGVSVSMYTYRSGKNAWAAALIAVAAATVLFALFAKILELFPNKNLFEICTVCFGKTAGKILTAVISLYAFVRGIIAIRSFCEMAAITSLNETPILFVAVFVTLAVAFMIKCGLYVMGKCSLLFVIIIAAIAAVTTLLSIGVMRFENIMPGKIALSPIFTDAVNLIAHPFGDAILVMCMFSHIKNKDGRRKIFFTALIIAGAVITVSILRDILVLGGETFSTLYFPSYSATSIINIFNFIQRIAVFDAVKTLFSVIIECCVCLYCVSKSISFIVRYDSYKSMAFPTAMLMAVVSAAAFSSTMQLTAFSTALAYVSLPAQIVLCVILLSAGVHKKRLK